MSLRDACNEYLIKGQQGQLVVKFVNDVHLCKILVADGEAVHISHGRMAPELILDMLPAKVVEWVNFIAGYPVRKKLDLPLQERLLQAANGQRPATPATQTSATTTTAQVVSSVKASGPLVPAEQVDAAIYGFIDQIGPLGTILSEQVAASIDYVSGQPMAESLYLSFVSTLSKEVPTSARAHYLKQFTPPIN